MALSLRLAVPTMGSAGEDSSRSGHFGRCDCFTVFDIEDGKIVGFSEVANPPHEEGGCLRPVGLLADAKCNAIVVAGMGARPLMGFQDAGITVYFDNASSSVGLAAQAVIEGKAPIMDPSQACRH